MNLEGHHCPDFERQFRDPNIELWFATHNIECRRGLDQQNVAIWFVASGAWKCSTGQRFLYTGVKRIRVAHEMSCIANFVHCFWSSGTRKSSVWSLSTTKLDANCACKAPQWHLLGHCKETNHNWHKGSKLSNITGMPRWFFLMLHNRFYTWGRKKAWKMKPSNMGSKYRSLIRRLVLGYQKTTPFF